VSGRIWALDYDASGVTGNELLYSSVGNLTTFGLGPNDELYFAGFADDVIYQFNCSTLPVELSAFRGTLAGGGVRLTWQTASENGNAGFEVQRRAGKTPGWMNVGYVDSQAPGGTTNTPQRYRFTDASPPFTADTLRYRLRQIDHDGQATVTDPVVIFRSVTELELKTPFPNPVQGRATIRYAVPTTKDVTLRIYDLLGREVKTVATGTRRGRRQIQINVSDLSGGTYFLRLTAGEQTVTRQFSVMR
jgi:hypothetical protein